MVQTLSPQQTRARLQVIYDSLRTARMNELYYTGEVLKLQRVTRALQITVALFATSSPIAGWALWSSPGGKNLWALLAGSAAVISIVSPFLKMDDKLKTSSELATGYCLLTFDLRAIKNEISGSQALTQKADEQYEATVARTRELATKDLANVSIADRQKLQAQVNQEIPPTSLWVP